MVSYFVSSWKKLSIPSPFPAGSNIEDIETKGTGLITASKEGSDSSSYILTVQEKPATGTVKDPFPVGSRIEDVDTKTYAQIQDTTPGLADKEYVLTVAITGPPPSPVEPSPPDEEPPPSPVEPSPPSPPDEEK